MTVEEALAKSEHYMYQDSAVVKTLADEVIRLREQDEALRMIADAAVSEMDGWQERAEAAEESSRVNYAAFSDQLCRHKETLRRAEAAEAERDKYKNCLLRLRDDHKAPPLHQSAWDFINEALEAKP